MKIRAGGHTMKVGRWHILYLGTKIGDFDIGWKMMLRRRDFHRLGGNVLMGLGPFEITRIAR